MHSLCSVASSSRNLLDAEEPDGIAHAGIRSRVSCLCVCVRARGGVCVSVCTSMAVVVRINF